MARIFVKLMATSFYFFMPTRLGAPAPSRTLQGARSSYEVHRHLVVLYKVPGHLVVIFCILRGRETFPHVRHVLRIRKQSLLVEVQTDSMILHYRSEVKNLMKSLPSHTQHLTLMGSSTRQGNNISLSDCSCFPSYFP